MVTVATFNIRHGLGTDGVVDIERTAEVVAASEADVVALQEVDRNRARSGNIDQARVVGRRAGLDFVFWPTLSDDGGEYGIALGYRGAADVSFEALPRVGSEEPRGAIVAEWRGLTIVATHLSTAPRAKARQLREVARLGASGSTPTVVMGDFNLSRRRLGPLTRAGFHYGEYRMTFGRRLGSRAIDHILAGADLRILRTWTIPGPASDHALLVAEIGIP